MDPIYEIELQDCPYCRGTGTVEDGLFPSTYRVKWDIVGEPKVSILIPQQGPHRGSGKVSAQHLDKDRMGAL